MLILAVTALASFSTVPFAALTSKRTTAALHLGIMAGRDGGSVWLAPLLGAVVEERILVQVSGVVVHCTLVSLLFLAGFWLLGRLGYGWCKRIWCIFVCERLLGAISELFLVGLANGQVLQLILKLHVGLRNARILVIPAVWVDTFAHLLRILFMAIDRVGEDAVDEHTRVERHHLGLACRGHHLVFTLNTLSFLLWLEELRGCGLLVRLIDLWCVKFFP